MFCRTSIDYRREGYVFDYLLKYPTSHTDQVSLNALDLKKMKN